MESGKLDDSRAQKAKPAMRYEMQVLADRTATSIHERQCQAATPQVWKPAIQQAWKPALRRRDTP